MKHKPIYCLLVIILLVGMHGCASAGLPENTVTVLDSTELTVVSTSVAICEILERLDYKQVIGVPATQYDLPQLYRSLQTVGAPMNPDIEVIKSLAPSIVLSPATLEDSLAGNYLTAGINSAFLDLSSVDGMYQAITGLGKLLACEEKADALVSEYELFINDSDLRPEGPEILLLMAFPDGFHLIATEDSYVGNLVQLAGGKNVYGSNYQGDSRGFAAINPEDLIQKNPDKILVFAHYSEAATFEYMNNAFATESIWGNFSCVADGEIYYLPIDQFGMSATLSWQDSIEYLTEVFYGV